MDCSWPLYSTLDSSTMASGCRASRTEEYLASAGESSYRWNTRTLLAPASTVKPPIGPVKIHCNRDCGVFHSSMTRVRSKSAGNHSMKYWRGRPVTVQRKRSEGGKGKSIGSPPASTLGPAGRASFCTGAGAFCPATCAAAGVASRVVWKSRREIFMECQAPALSGYGADVKKIHLASVAPMRRIDYDFLPVGAVSGMQVAAKLAIVLRG